MDPTVNKEKSYILGRTCPRCQHKTPIFSGVELSASSTLPIQGKFAFPCEACGWSMECSVDNLEEIPEVKDSA